MASPSLIARSQRQYGIAAVDTSTLMHFGIGTVAGIGGIDPKMALLVALMAEGAWEVIQAQDPEAIFHRGVGQSKINEIIDLLSMVVGAYVGHGIRAVVQKEPVVPSAPAPTAPAVGLGNPGKIVGMMWDERLKRWVFVEAAA